MTYPREQNLQFHLHHCNRKQTTTVRKRLNTNGCSVASSKWDREFQAVCAARIADRHKCVVARQRPLPWPPQHGGHVENMVGCDHPTCVPVSRAPLVAAVGLNSLSFFFAFNTGYSWLYVIHFISQRSTLLRL